LNQGDKRRKRIATQDLARHSFRVSTPEDPAVRCQHVLVVEDESLIALLHEQTLESAGFRVSIAASGEQALAIAREVCPDGVVLDMRFSGALQGPEVLRLLRGVARNLPVVVVTGFSLTPDQRRELDQTGGGPPVPVLRKPCDPDLLVAELVACLGRGGGGTASLRR
jgi:CheY-like chemotaxis protein